MYHQPSSGFVPFIIPGDRYKQLQADFERSGDNAPAMTTVSIAAQMGDIETTKKLLELGVDREFLPNLDGEERKKLLDKIKTKLENIEKLLSTGIVFIPDAKTVAENPFAKEMFKVDFILGTEFWMQLMIDPHVVRVWDSSKNKDGWYPLHYLCSLPDVPVEPVRYVLECKPIDINRKTGTGYTALVIAILRENYPVTTYLVENGASLSHAPLLMFNMDELGSYYPYMKAFCPFKVTLPQMQYYFTPLDAAAFLNQEDFVCYLLKKGANVRINTGIWNCLFYPIAKGKRRIVERLLDGGVDVNGPDLLGASPLHKAAGEGKIDLTHVLMRRGANVNAKDKYGWTPLHIACLFSRNVSIEMIQLLLDGGADIHAKTKYGFSALSLAEAGYDLVFLNFLADNRHRLFKSSMLIYMPKEKTDNEHEDIMTLLLDNGADCNDQDKFLGWTALHWAAAAGDMNTVQLLVSRGAKISIKSKYKLDPYQTALTFNREAISNFLRKVTEEAHTI